MKILLKSTDRPIDMIAQNPNFFRGKRLTLQETMLQKLIGEALESGKDNLKIIMKNDDETIYDFSIPGKFTTYVTIMRHKHDYTMVGVDAKNIHPRVVLNTESNPPQDSVVNFEYAE